MIKKKAGTIQKSLFWSGSSEIAVKLIVPISNMLLARILTPEAFGVLAISILVISFLDIITDAGFGKYLVQYDFRDEKERDECANVAFWSNLVFSFFLCGILIINSEWIAELLGGSEYSAVISVASLQLVFTSMVSIQMGLMRRDFQFKKLFVARISVALVPLVVTVPLAIITKSYWALIIGNISASVVNAIILFLGSKWRPRLFYSFKLLKKMFSFSFWSLCEALAHWSIFWVDTFIVLQFYSNYYLGIYKNSSNMILSLFGMITAAISPVLLSVLSRIKNENEFFSIFLHIEKIIMYILFPMGVGIFFYKETITTILFGSKWIEASNIIGAWALMMVVSVVIYSFPAEALKAKGIPKVLFFYQLSYIVFLVPVCIIAAKIDFWTFVYVRALSIAEQFVICLVILKKVLHWNISVFIKNMLKPILASFTVVILCTIFKSIFPESFMFHILSIIMIIVIYFVILFVFFKKDLLLSLKVIQEKRIVNKV